MAKYLFTYHGGAGMPETQEEIDAVVAAWGSWFESVGAATLDAGNPTGAAKTVAADGSVSDGSATGHTTGYGLFSADNHGAAVEIAKGCPVLSGGGSVEVYETIDM
ncbi:MAG: hypothetical protein GXP35_11975 [Actinobacteria bacterium]|nr:hypothetical protein [Actinomycetota bacterium]